METILASIASGVLSGSLVGILTLRFHYKNLYADTVSKNRMEWINNFREEVSTIIATLKSSKNYSKGNHIYEAEKAKAKLLTRLNQNTSKNGNEYNDVLAEVLAKLNFDQIEDDLDDTVDILIDLTRKILEPEWRRVKREAKGKE
ncbi:hypothetical protein [Evtepia sp.]|uniref:hypothetical protein n=1 Tax=Evtepia sp. TaxID=2773933 RepID=UPI002A84101F|nr:hypothetical protein [Evtepia sp.]MDY4429636.1 hypothetical protein [Evtepia sp.]